MDPQVAVRAADDRRRHDCLDLLRHHADIDLVAVLVGEAVEAEAVGEMAEQDDVVLERDIGAPAATAATTAAAPMAHRRPVLCHAALTSRTLARAGWPMTRLPLMRPRRLLGTGLL